MPNCVKPGKDGFYAQEKRAEPSGSALQTLLHPGCSQRLGRICFQHTGSVKDSDHRHAHIGEYRLSHGGHAESAQNEAQSLYAQGEHNVLLHDAQAFVCDIHGGGELGRVIVHEHHVGGLNGGV